MFLNNRQLPPELLHYQALEKRSTLNHQERIKLKILKLGYEGECLYDEIFNQVGHENIYILRDLYLKIGESVTQYDSIIVSNSGVVVNEIKYYSGDYRYENGNWYNRTRRLTDDPILQVGRAVNNLSKLINNANINSEVTGKVVFPNDDFRLTTDDVKIWDKVVMRTNMKSYFRQFKNEGLSEYAETITTAIQNCITENPYMTKNADMQSLKKGLYCGSCGSFSLIKRRYHFDCSKCGNTECNETHMLRSMSDHKFLFYGKDMTRNSILTLIDYELPKKVLYRVFLKYCNVRKNGNKTNYTLKYYNFADAYEKHQAFKRYKNYKA